jgi:hypothetical protein
VNTNLTQLARIFRIRQEQNHDLPKVLAWAEKLLRALYEDQVEFHRTVTDFNSHAKVTEVETLLYPGGKRKEVREPLAIFRTDSEHASQAARSSKTGFSAFLLVQNSRGSVQIFPDSKKISKGSERGGFDMRRLFRMLQFLEMRRKPVSVRDSFDFHAPIQDGTDARCPEWNLFEQAGMIFNGSLTHPDVPVTTIPLSEIEFAFKSAFHPGRYAAWMNRYGIAPHPKSPRAQTSRTVEALFIEPETSTAEPERRSPDQPGQPVSAKPATSSSSATLPLKWVHPTKPLREWRRAKRNALTRSDISHCPATE